MSKEQIDIAVLKEQICENKKDISVVDAKGERILTNHLPHIQDKVDKINIRLAWIGGAIAVISFIMPFIAPFIIKNF